MANFGFDQIHIADAALVLLKSRNLFRVGRPYEHRSIAVNPTGVVGRIAEIFYTIGGELRLFARGCIAYPEIEVANERRALLVGREDFRRRAATSAEWRTLAGRLRRI